MKKELIIRLINRINTYILPLCNNYNINNGGCGMFAVLISRRLKEYYLRTQIKASFINHSNVNTNFYNAEHYSIIIDDFEINPFCKEANSTLIKYYSDINEEQLYWLQNACKGYNHKHDIEIKQIINKNI